MATMLLPLAFLTPSFGELLVVAIVALLLYGGDLPKVAKTWGKAYQDFRRHLNGIQRDLNDAINAEEDSPRRLQYYPEYRDDADDAEADDVAEAPEHHSPVAEAAAAEAEAARLAAAQPAAGEFPAGSEPLRQDHGAA